MGAGTIDDELIRSYGIVAMVVVASLAWFFMAFRKRVSHAEAVVLLGAYALSVVLLTETALGESIRDLIEAIA